MLLELPLLNGVKRETLRLFPAAFGVYRRAARDFTFRGVDVAEGEDVLLFTTAAHVDPEAFPDPYRFDPRRPAEAYKDGQVFAPYGKGPHACLGAGMAEVLLSAVLARWVAGWELTSEAPGARHPVVFDPTPSVARSFRVHARRR